MSMSSELHLQRIAAMRKSNRKISLIIDSWTPQSNKYTLFGIIACYTDDSWNLQQTCLGFVDVTEGQAGSQLNQVLVQILNKHQLRNQILAITGDNGGHFSADDFNLLLQQCSDEQSGSSFLARPKSRPVAFIRCLAHVLNLVCQEIFNNTVLGKISNIISQQDNIGQLLDHYHLSIDDLQYTTPDDTFEDDTSMIIKVSTILLYLY